MKDAVDLDAMKDVDMVLDTTTVIVMERPLLLVLLLSLQSPLLPLEATRLQPFLKRRQRQYTKYSSNYNDS
ncbi:hypothetical protein QR680_013792 [Steinernema hermaphroditum]|uniref:Uncharacterized protein n=1 Tax=Steinernema hermaphroditum TaxID=289476 RepID=A0AA39I6P2_9BILA|nr:hypothetical protein QR680_013792 [Steinernema hermaphroditum]